MTALGGVTGGITEMATTTDTSSLPIEYILISAAIGAIVGFIINKMLDWIWAGVRKKIQQ